MYGEQQQPTIRILLMEEIKKSCQPVEVGRLSHDLQGFLHHPRWCRISAINSLTSLIFLAAESEWPLPCCCDSAMPPCLVSINAFRFCLPEKDISIWISMHLSNNMATYYIDLYYTHLRMSWYIYIYTTMHNLGSDIDCQTLPLIGCKRQPYNIPLRFQPLFFIFILIPKKLWQ